MSSGLFGSGIFGAGIFGAPVDDTPTPATPAPPTPTPPHPANPDWKASDPGLAIIGTNGDVIMLRVDGRDFGALRGATGFGIPPKVLTIFEGAADGGTFRYVRTGPRDIDLPIGIFGRSRGEIAERQRRLAAALRVRPGLPPARLQFALETGEVYETAAYYVSGAETQITDSDGTAMFARWPITLRCPDPFWTSTVETAFQLGNRNAEVRSLIAGLGRLQLTTSQVLGDVQLNNPGDVPADVVWTITGPGGPFTATSSTGESFTITDVLAAGESITIDTKTGAVTDQTGANRYTSLGNAPKLFKLPDGQTIVRITLAGASPQSTVVGRFRARREVVY